MNRTYLEQKTRELLNSDENLEGIRISTGLLYSTERLILEIQANVRQKIFNAFAPHVGETFTIHEIQEVIKNVDLN